MELQTEIFLLNSFKLADANLVAKPAELEEMKLLKLSIFIFSS
jgi:hypothetical protein